MFVGLDKKINKFQYVIIWHKTCSDNLLAGFKMRRWSGFNNIKGDNYELEILAKE
jgi:hypothetical protein